MGSMNRTAARLTVSAAFVLLGLGRAAAADFCLTGTGKINVMYVAKGFKVPAKGTCAVWSGFCASGCSPDNIQTGAACTASDGSHVSFALTTAYLLSNRQWDWVRLDLPALTGNGNFNDFEEGFGATVSYDASGGRCTNSLPVP
jgi:hypothetical protein